MIVSVALGASANDRCLLVADMFMLLVSATLC